MSVITISSLLLWLSLATPASSDPLSAPVPQEERGSIEVRLLANEGFLVRSDTEAVLIDAFVSQPFSIYGEVPAEVLREITAGGAPFQHARLALISHVHQDHFQAEVASFYLLKRPDAQIWSSPQVIDAITSTVDEVRETNLEGLRKPVDPERLQVVLPQTGRTEHRDFGNIHVEFLRLPHGSKQHSAIENIGHLLHVNGQRVLHIGDATMDAQFFEPYNLSARQLDVALIPYWFFEDPVGQATIDKHLKARYQIAVHIPVRELDAIKSRLQEHYPDVIILETPMQFMRF